MNHRIAIPTILCGIMLAAAAAAADAPALDSITKLPLPTGADAVQVGTPMALPAWQVCKKTARANFYGGASGKVGAAVAWYSAHLKGFRHLHAYNGGRSHEVLYNPEGTSAVSITGTPAPAGQDADVHSVSYLQFQPGLSEKEIAGVNSGNLVCS